MFIEYFIYARECLTQQGLKPALVMGTPVSENDLHALDEETDLPMPPELRRFYLEMGDGFRFIPDMDPHSDLVEGVRPEKRFC